MEMIRVRDFKLVFEQGKHKGVWRLFDKRCTFNHCEILANDGYGWMIISSIRGHIKIYTLPLSIENDPSITLSKKPGIKVLSTKRFNSQGLRVTYLGPWTCVEVCKAVIGLSCWWITTPDMLLSYCMARNNEVSLSRIYILKCVARSSIMYLSAPFVSVFSIISTKLRG